MRSQRLVQIVGCHAEGEVGDVIIGGVAPPPGDTLWQQSRFIARDQSLRRFVLNEPRGGVFRHVNLLVPPKDPRADMGFIIMEPEDTPPMSGSNSLCVATVLLETGILPMTEPETVMTLEAPGGLIRVHAACSEGRVDSVRVHNVASFAARLGAALEVEGSERSPPIPPTAATASCWWTLRRSASHSAPTKRGTSSRRGFGSPVPPTSSWASSIPRTPIGGISRSARSPRRFRASTAFRRAATPW